MGRSGSTLIELLLGGLPGFCSVGETVHLWRRGLLENERCGCGKAFLDCGFWSEVGERAFGGWGSLDVGAVLSLKDGVDRTRFLPALLDGGGWGDGAFATRGRLYVDLYHRLHGAVAEVSGARVVVDASKHVSLAACLRRGYGDRMRLLHVVRDPRAVAHSWSRRVARPDASPDSREKEMARYSAGRAAVQWMTQNAGLDALARRGVSTLKVRYEDFVADPDREFGRIADFVGHDGPPLDLGGAGVESVEGHAVSGNPMRFGSGPVGVRADHRWREELAPWRRCLVEAVTAPVRGRYGY
jgi:hypothetical protein